MADEKINNDGNSMEDFGALTGGKKDDFANLPPLSDFNSKGDEAFSDGSLPPLSGISSDGGKSSNPSDGGFLGGLPPIDEISIETPVPTGGNIKSPPPGFEENKPASFEFSFDTPQSSGGGFDIAADSDFSPETPEIGPGPDSDLDTPLYDSAFGGGSGPVGGGFGPPASSGVGFNVPASSGMGFGAPSMSTPAPTQTMETPMFGAPPEGAAGAPPAAPGGFSFDDNAFGNDIFGGGTPAPDFSADTGARAGGSPFGPPPLGPEGGDIEEEPVKKGGKGMLFLKIAVCVALLVGGIVARPYINDFVAFLPNPQAKALEDANGRVKTLEDENRRLKNIQGASQGQVNISPEEVQKLIKQQEELTVAIRDLTAQQETAQAKVTELQGQVAQVTADLDAKNNDYVAAQQAYEDLTNETSIVRAQRAGLDKEVASLTTKVGELEDANKRRLIQKNALASDLNALEILIKESCPLTPKEFATEDRLAKVQEVKTLLEEAAWVDDAIMNKYNDVVRRELEKASAKIYFFAKVQVADTLGTAETKWAECLMNGNWSVYYRTIDGKNVGVYENAGSPEVPNYVFRQELTEDAQRQVQTLIAVSRTSDFEDRLKFLAGKEAAIYDGESSIKRIFKSL